jgi:hypothetical protein
MDITPSPIKQEIGGEASEGGRVGRKRNAKKREGHHLINNLKGKLSLQISRNYGKNI